MTPTTFFRLLHTPIDAKGDALAERIAALNDSASLNTTGAAEETYTLDPAAFAQIPGSPFAYWVSDSILRLFRDCDSSKKMAGQQNVDHPVETISGGFGFGGRLPPRTSIGMYDGSRSPKAGRSLPITAICICWLNGMSSGTPFAISTDAQDERYLSWSHQVFSFALAYLASPEQMVSVFGFLPAGCVFGHKGPAAFHPTDNGDDLLVLAAVMNSASFESLVQVQLARTELRSVLRSRTHSANSNPTAHRPYVAHHPRHPCPRSPRPPARPRPDRARRPTPSASQGWWRTGTRPHCARPAPCSTPRNRPVRLAWQPSRRKLTTSSSTCTG